MAALSAFPGILAVAAWAFVLAIVVSNMREPLRQKAIGVFLVSTAAFSYWYISGLAIYWGAGVFGSQFLLVGIAASAFLGIVAVLSLPPRGACP